MHLLLGSGPPGGVEPQPADPSGPAEDGLSVLPLSPKKGVEGAISAGELGKEGGSHAETRSSGAYPLQLANTQILI